MSQEIQDKKKLRPTQQNKSTRRSGSAIGVRLATWLAAGILVLVPFHAFLTVWGASFGLNYTALRLWSAVMLAALLCIQATWFVRDATLRQWVKQSYLVQTIVLFGVIQVIFGLRGLVLHAVNLEALLFGILLNLRYLLYFLSMIILVKYSGWPRGRWVKIVLSAGVIVAAFAILQYTALPHDFLRHFGYSTATIEPMQTINNNPAYIRVASTLRGANPLGAYMLVCLSVLIAVWVKTRKPFVQLATLLLLVSALLFSFSRSAWLGATVALAVWFVFHMRGRLNRMQIGSILLGMLILTGVIFIAFHQNRLVQNAIFHTDDDSKIALSSNDQRESAIKTAVREVLHEPLGRGVGSAGPASAHNTFAAPRIAENYYLQVAQEVGWAGLIVYIGLSLAVAFQLWRQRHDKLALGVFAAFIGLVVVNMLSHAWTDDTLAFTWWGLAGIVIGEGIWQKPKREQKSRL